MKRLKFHPSLVPLILDGSKTATWRVFDDKELTAGDFIEFVDARDGTVFVRALLTDVKTTSIGALSDEDRVGHEPFTSSQDTLEQFQEYYGNAVTLDTPLKIVRFKVTEALDAQAETTDE